MIAIKIVIIFAVVFMNLFCFATIIVDSLTHAANPGVIKLWLLCLFSYFILNSSCVSEDIIILSCGPKSVHLVSGQPLIAPRCLWLMLISAPPRIINHCCSGFTVSGCNGFIA